MSRVATLGCVALGGSIGALARWAAPWPTVVTNVVGCALMGVLVVWLERRVPGRWARPSLGVGFLGGFTTFSAYAVDTALPMVDADPLAAALSLALTPVAALVAVVLGVAVARRLIPPRRST